MTDEKIIELFWARDERAINETEKKYRSLCLYVASNILAQKEDCEECLNDVLLSLWNNIPPEKPQNLRSYIGTATRNHALNRSKEANAWKRGKNYQIVGDEFLATVADGHDLAEGFEAKRAGGIINKFLETLKTDDRRIFIMRFWLGFEYSKISKHTGFGESKIKVSIHRSRKRLAEMLSKEGITL
ncbi:MAG: sigma-70 family RNA polymerase sigma factor [Clostridia bacterium]|nr:sigma-70 family RNA polymerase sigma factor [Clostridia bacterium]